MTAITTIKTQVPAVARIRTGAAQANTGQTDWIGVPSWAHYALFFFEWTAAAGTTPTAIFSINVAEPITLLTTGLGTLKLAEAAAHAALTAPNTDEIQTLTLTAGLATDTFTLTQGGVASAAVTIPVGGYASVTAALIKTALLTIPALASHTADIAVVKTVNDYAITFSNALGATDQGAITVTNKTGSADGSVAETLKGVGGAVVFQVGPDVTGIVDDTAITTGLNSYISYNAILPPVIGLTCLFDRTTGNETYTYTVTSMFRA